MTSLLTGDQLQESIDIHNDGYKILKAGQIESGLALIEKSCEFGLPNALATLIWTKLLLNDVDGAIASYQKYSNFIDSWFESYESIFGAGSSSYLFGEQKLNAQTNYATALYLAGESADRVITTCALANEKRWPEALLLTCMARSGQANAEFTRKNILELIDTFKRVQQDFVDTSQSQISPGATKRMTFLEYAKSCQKKLEELPIQDLESEMDSDFEHDHGMLIGDMAGILVDFARSEESNNHPEFFTRNGLTIRVCIALNGEYVKITEKGFDAIEQAWFDLCALFNEDPYAIYESLDDLMGIDYED